MSKIIYRNGDFGVHVEPSTNGTVTILAGELSPRNDYRRIYTNNPYKRWTCNAVGWLWWNPTTWYLRTVSRGVYLGIRHADYRQRKVEEAAMNYDYAQQLIANIDVHQEVVAELEQGLLQQ